jgi:nitroreductase
LILTVAKLDHDHIARPNRHAYYDLGQAVAHLTVEATALGLYVHQMGGFDPRLARELFAIPAGSDPVSVVAVGYHEGPSPELSTRTRKPLASMVYSGIWGRPAATILPNQVQGAIDA